MTDTLSYLVFGKRREYQLELTWSVLSAVRHLRRDPADIRIVLVTEEGNERPDLPIEHVHFSPAEFASWTGDGRNVHRIKEFALLKVLDRYRGKVAHLDPDTYFIDHPRRLFERVGPGQTVMHENEGPLGRHPIWAPLLEKGVSEVAGYPVTPQSPMYNSGVIGLTYEDCDLLRRSVELEDALFDLAWVFNIEQFATGAVLRAHTRLSECKDLLVHYWGPQRHFINLECDRRYPAFTREAFERLVGLPELPLLGYPPMGLWDRLASYLLIGRRARDGDYRFAYLAARCAASCARRDPALANAWARVALEGLRFVQTKSTSQQPATADDLRRDFQLFCHTPAWLSPDLTSAWQAFWDASKPGGGSEQAIEQPAQPTGL